MKFQNIIYNYINIYMKNYFIYNKNRIEIYII